jgi:hypothetical protein
MKDFNIRRFVPADATDWQDLYEPDMKTLKTPAVELPIVEPAVPAQPPVELPTPPTGEPATPAE